MSKKSRISGIFRHTPDGGLATLPRIADLGVGDPLPFTPALEIRPGMVVVDERGGHDLVESVRDVELDRPVYDLDIEETHNFIANVIITHNSISGVRGAGIGDILKIEDE